MIVFYKFRVISIYASTTDCRGIFDVSVSCWGHLMSCSGLVLQTASKIYTPASIKRLSSCERVLKHLGLAAFDQGELCKSERHFIGET